MPTVLELVQSRQHTNTGGGDERATLLLNASTTTSPEQFVTIVSQLVIPISEKIRSGAPMYDKKAHLLVLDELQVHARRFPGTELASDLKALADVLIAHKLTPNGNNRSVAGNGVDLNSVGIPLHKLQLKPIPDDTVTLTAHGLPVLFPNDREMQQLSEQSTYVQPVLETTMLRHGIDLFADTAIVTKLNELFVLPMAYPSLLEPVRSLLIRGPSGSGKTTIARMLPTLFEQSKHVDAFSVRAYRIQASNLLHKWGHDTTTPSYTRIRVLFAHLREILSQMAAGTSTRTPRVVIIIEDVDSLEVQGVQELQAHMTKAQNKHIIVIGVARKCKHTTPMGFHAQLVVDLPSRAQMLDTIMARLNAVFDGPENTTKTDKPNKSPGIVLEQSKASHSNDNSKHTGPRNEILRNEIEKSVLEELLFSHGGRTIFEIHTLRHTLLSVRADMYTWAKTYDTLPSLQLYVKIILALPRDKWHELKQFSLPDMKRSLLMADLEKLNIKTMGENVEENTLSVKNRQLYDQLVHALNVTFAAIAPHTVPQPLNDGIDHPEKTFDILNETLTLTLPNTAENFDATYDTVKLNLGEFEAHDSPDHLFGMNLSDLDRVMTAVVKRLNMDLLGQPIPVVGGKDNTKCVLRSVYTDNECQVVLQPELDESELEQLRRTVAQQRRNIKMLEEYVVDDEKGTPGEGVPGNGGGGGGGGEPGNGRKPPEAELPGLEKEKAAQKLQAQKLKAEQLAGDRVALEDQEAARLMDARLAEVIARTESPYSDPNANTKQDNVFLLSTDKTFNDMEAAKAIKEYRNKIEQHEIDLGVKQTAVNDALDTYRADSKPGEITENVETSARLVLTTKRALIKEQASGLRLRLAKLALHDRKWVFQPDDHNVYTPKTLCTVCDSKVKYPSPKLTWEWVDGMNEMYLLSVIKEAVNGTQSTVNGKDILCHMDILKNA
jgi:energy-coupling factor transporter ATP-binding protein EcfA2